MSSYAPPFGLFAYPAAPVPPFAACSGQVSATYKSSIGTAFETAAQSSDAAHTLQALKKLVLEYVHSLTSKYSTLRANRTEKSGTCDHDSKHLLLQQELALLHEIIDIRHDMQKLQCQYAGSREVVGSIQGIRDTLVSLL